MTPHYLEALVNGPDLALGLGTFLKLAKVDSAWHSRLAAAAAQALPAADRGTAREAANLLIKIANAGGDISAAEPVLRQVVLTLSALDSPNNPPLSVGGLAGTALALFYLKHRRLDELAALLNCGGWPKWIALRAMGSAGNVGQLGFLHARLADELQQACEPLLPGRWWSSARAAAAGTLVRLSIAQGDWPAIGLWLRPGAPDICLGALGALDDHAEAGTLPMPLNQAVLGVLTDPGTTAPEIRTRAAGVLVWLVCNARGEQRPVTLDGIDIESIAEVRAALAEIGSLPRR